ncbi:NAD(P)-binding domain-containing protein [Leptospira sp. 2 VSF19]|uniref:NAD(P)-binding domain-containing protein n=1 Tax=Leptospira soteropolitanensis TaxID=2950025 RepID=A0AAW5VHZ2_9LEPT|nr:NAD(P)-binding domain-containing protein [Leptospira soteropolitanensis]MCW7493617.1 NAD(P)-binding domain-containing protein [Leptospira soteropolitanensis]MCW7501216.1 NAD(P)-binding domain-containing protein [Leptospira soteropolitanensis]MCW7523598.1 NAD(P)-binding domain-containing protein [Leptospira soteropolitanensis]MCW7527329.1 NAD(P)-binding domain-containing protein [Leptospira soteropolitanensis]MCW7531186.1 NAD(P)-binding domain-containing protein [Leptospira soteropolitanensi
MWPSSYFHWLTKSVPTGSVEIYPEISDTYETNLPNVFIIGDLTGVPLLKLAAESGVKVWEHIRENKADCFDAVIIGSGPAGLSCAYEANKLGKKYVVLEANLPFQTIQSYPKNKPIFAEPKEIESLSKIKIQNSTKEELLEYLNLLLKKEPIELQLGKRVTSIEANGSLYIVKTESGDSYLTNSVVIAIGKSGDPKRLGVAGESSPSVFYRLFDPYDAKEKSVAIIGGGDSAVEAAIACSSYANEVCLIHRGKNLQRPKAENLNRLKNLIEEGKVKLLLESEVTEISEKNIFVKTQSSAVKFKSDLVYILIGTTPPIPFLKRLGIKIQNEKSLSDWLGFVSLFSFAALAYFGKASFYGPGWFSPLATSFGFISILSFTLFLFSKLKHGTGIFQPWVFIRNSYLLFAFLYFLFVYFSATYWNQIFLGKFPSFHYTMLYSLTILVFGIRRILIRKTDYVFYQTISLIFIQIFFLFLLPELILPALGDSGYLGSPEGYIRTEVFPNDAYWKAYGFILAWPLSMGVLYDGGITGFWLGYGILFSFGFIPFLVYRYGKGAYCGWICSCGGLAETLGDEHRQKMPHGKWAYRLEHSGQYILLIAFLLTLLKLVGVYGKGINTNLALSESVADSVKWIYDIVVDIGLAGIVGVGFYFLFSGRIWCRMFCPLASLMHIYAKFSKFRIFSDKKKCISCNICTKNCHQGIDVMGYASRGIPMDSVQCVRCSACVSLCPTDVLEFGQLTVSGIRYDSIQAKLRK